MMADTLDDSVQRTIERSCPTRGGGDWQKPRRTRDQLGKPQEALRIDKEQRRLASMDDG